MNTLSSRGYLWQQIFIILRHILDFTTTNSDPTEGGKLLAKNEHTIEDVIHLSRLNVAIPMLLT